MRGGPQRREVPLHAGLDRSDQELHRDGPQAFPQVAAQHLAVAGRAEHAAEPLQLPGQPLGVRAGYDLAERPEGGAQPAGGHAHLVHRVIGVGARHRLEAA